MEIWELVGLWRYTTPGYFLLAQFGLGVLIAVGNLVNNSVFTYLSNETGDFPNGDHTIEGILYFVNGPSFFGGFLGKKCGILEILVIKVSVG